MQLQRVEINGKRWYKGLDGKLYPSAGSVLDILFPFNKDFIKEDDLARGVLCHEQTAQRLVIRATNTENGEYQPCNDAETEMRVDAVMEYLEKFQLETQSVEAPTMFLGIGMTPDYIAKEILPDLGWCMHGYDWKFAESLDESYFYQAELYARAEKCDKFTILQCNRKGEVFPHRVRPDAERWELLKSAINIRHHIAKKEIKRYA